MSGKGSVARNQSKLVKEGIKDEYGEDGLDLTASKRKGYPVQAHHCVCCSVIQKNNSGKLATLAVKSGYDVNNGKNNIFLPAKFGHMRKNNEQRHRGGHCQDYYNYVDAKLTKIYNKHQNAKPCPGNQDAKDILSDLMTCQDGIYSKLESRKLWLYGWSEELYNEDYREEGSSALTSSNQKGSSVGGIAWVETYPKGNNPRRKLGGNNQLLKSWYSTKGFPVPGNAKS